jgi:hypothetical protein
LRTSSVGGGGRKEKAVLLKNKHNRDKAHQITNRWYYL